MNSLNARGSFGCIVLQAHPPSEEIVMHGGHVALIARGREIIQFPWVCIFVHDVFLDVGTVFQLPLNVPRTPPPTSNVPSSLSRDTGNYRHGTPKENLSVPFPPSLVYCLTRDYSVDSCQRAGLVHANTRYKLTRDFERPSSTECSDVHDQETMAACGPVDYGVH